MLLQMLLLYFLETRHSTPIQWYSQIPCFLLSTLKSNKIPKISIILVYFANETKFNNNESTETWICKQLEIAQWLSALLKPNDLRSIRKEMLYLTNHSTHFIYGYMASDIWSKTTQIASEETHCRHYMDYSFWLDESSHRQDNTYHSHIVLAGTRHQIEHACESLGLLFLKTIDYIAIPI